MDGLIWNTVRRFAYRGYDKEDLYQIACIGFIEAVKRFDFTFNVELSTYSVQYMLGEIKKFLRDDGMIKVSRDVKELGIKIKELERIYLVKTGESLDINRISKILEMPKETIVYAKEASKTVESINEKVGDEGSELIDMLASKDDEQSKIVDRIAVFDLIEKLDFREKEIIKLRYFKDKTQTQVAKILGISQVHVSRIEKKILNDFKDKLIV
ncbi:MAG: sigma-70 family RNA polymerase sigma factor [Clostridia bacterium]|nr:sigma-70 family RNA polymerase sigma factor [Clostridia bacterium]